MTFSLEYSSHISQILLKISPGCSIRVFDFFGIAIGTDSGYTQAPVPVTNSGYDKDLEWAISVGLAERDGNIIQFSPDFERMATCS